MRAKLEHILDANKLPSTYVRNGHLASEIYINEKCPIYTYINSLESEASQKTAKYALSAIAKHKNLASAYEINWLEVDRNWLHDLRAKLSGIGLSPNTTNLYLTIIKRILKEAFFLGYISRLRFETVMDVKGISYSKTKVHGVLSYQQFDKILKDCDDNTNLGKRDMAIIALTVGCGLRRFESAKIVMSDLNLASKKLEVKGKGGKFRNLYIHDVTMKQIEPWLLIRGLNPGPFFLPIHKSDQIDFSRLDTGQTINSNTIYGCCTRRGLMDLEQKIPPHSLRRTYATWLYRNKVSLEEIRKLLGHTFIETTKNYVVTSDDELRQSVMDNLF